MRGQDIGGAGGTCENRPLITEKPLAVPEFVSLAIDLARALDDRHRREGTHGGLGPDTVRIDPTGAVHITAPVSTPASPACAAPEQTGRLEYGVDERTDLYALGVLLYQLIGGRLPFPAGTPAQWWQRHLTERPAPLDDLAVPLPPSLREIIFLLLEKSPDDRYQTARGLVVDLERCRDALAAGNGATPLLLRMRDVPERLRLSGRVYGRERQLSRLQAAYERVAAGGPAELVAVTADTGLGRWAVVASFADSVVTAGGQTLRACGAADDDAPYAALTRLLGDLAAQLSDAPAEHRARIADAVGACGATLVELAPALRTILGEHRPPSPGPVAAARNRIYLATRRLLNAVSAPGRPMVIAIRDAQWADPPTVDLLRYVLAAPDAPSVLTVVTYRPGDVGPDHPLHALVDDNRVPSSSVALRPLPDSALTDLLVDTLRSGRRDSSNLARTVAARTGSNPLLVGQFLHWLADRRLLAYTDEGASWQWQRRVEEEPPVANVTALVAPRLELFPADTLALLELAAVLGPRFDAATLAAAASLEGAGASLEGAAASLEGAGASVEGAAASLEGAAASVEGAADVAGRLRPALHAELLTATATGGYRWCHEHVRQVVLESVDQDRLTELRLAAGRALAPNPDLIFDAVAHLNAAAERLPAPDELARLNLAAGQRAIRVGAPEAARGYFAAGLDRLGAGCWQRCPDLTLRLHLAAADAERATGDRVRAERLLGEAAPHVSTDVDRARLLHLHALLRLDSGDRPGALQVGIEALRQLRLPLPAEPERWPEAAVDATERVRRRLDPDTLDRVAEAPACTEPRVILAADLIADLTYPTLSEQGPGRDLLSAVGVELALGHGPTGTTGYNLTRFALVLAQRRHDRDAHLCARLAVRLLDRPGVRYPASARATAAVVGPLWLEAPESMIRDLYTAYRVAVEAGDVSAAQDIGAIYTAHQFAMGVPLDQVAAEIDARWRFALRHGRDAASAAVTRLLDEAVSRLLGVSCEAPTATSEEEAATRRMLRGEHGYRSVVGLGPLLAVAHLLGDHEEVAQFDDVTGQIVNRAPTSFLTAETAFWHALSLATRCETAEPPEREAICAELDAVQDAIDDLAARGPALFRARALLLAAERARVAGDSEPVRARFDRAIGAARECGFLRLEALAAELCGRHALANGDAADAVAYLRRARACYHRWGAEAKLDEIDELLLSAIPSADASRSLDQLDLLTVVRSFQAISGELRLERLVGVLLELLLQHSQSDRGCLLLADGATLRLAADAEAERDRARVTIDLCGQPDPQVPLHLIEEAGRNRAVLAGDPDELAAFASDAYLAAQRPRSVLCAPIVRRDTLLAVLYLEYRRVPATFSSSYLELLDMLCAQAAIALENATVHARLVEANRILDATFDQLPIGLILLGPDLSVRRASPRAVELMGVPVTPGTPLAELIEALAPTDLNGHPYQHEPGTEPAAALLPGPIRRDAVIVTPAGDRLRLTTSSMPLRDETGRLVGLTVLVSPF